MELTQLARYVEDATTVRRVFGDPIECDGVTLVPVAAVAGGGGGGGGHDASGQEGEGGGFGVQARPVGAFVLCDGEVRWRPALDVARLATIGGLSVAVLAVTRARVAHHRAGPSADRRRRGRS